MVDIFHSVKTSPKENKITCHYAQEYLTRTVDMVSCELFFCSAVRGLVTWSVTSYVTFVWVCAQAHTHKRNARAHVYVISRDYLSIYILFEIFFFFLYLCNALKFHRYRKAGGIG